MRIKASLKESSLAPVRMHKGDAGMDLRTMEDFTIKPGERVKLRTGVSIQLPKHHAAYVIPRSGLAANHGITCLNSPGLIDSNYRGEIGVILANLGDKPFEGCAGDRIAQLVVSGRLPSVKWQTVKSLEESERGSKGFGSSGVA